MTSTAPVTDERIHRDVLEPLLRAALGVEPVTGDQRLYDYGEVPGADGNDGVLPSVYVLLTVERRYVGPRRAGRAGRSGWRITARYVGRNVDEARWALDKVTDAIDEARLTIGGYVSTPVTHESSTAIEPDDGRFSGLTVWTYAL
ncbi:MAG TPA: hypothetical protein VJL80_09730 [Aeromicrobium sp.]|nr:hypothetical protein [Aeromicrobium sp.]HKY58305.1 hypothetical protein [Aeromicrobium sp.]